MPTPTSQASSPSSPAPHGRVRSLHRKPETSGEHGLPKPSVAEIDIASGGVRQDFNRFRHEELHDRPDQAILLMAVEMIRALNAEGWPVQEGDLGENVTTEGIPYGEFHPGDCFRVGAAVLEVSKACTPCTNLELLPYVGISKGPSFIKTMLDRRGWYASVIQEGRVQAGDMVERI
ncbi:MAG: MOSC domain-containing protein [Thermoplasmata archaeon]|nr:MOSC domain-containing protein [Thermoplasmata archaeon]